MEWLYRYNPWWFDPRKIDEDRSIIRWKESLVKAVNNTIYNEIMNKIDRKRGGLVYIFRGPRQVGKTTLLKILIRKFIEKGINPDAILYLPLDAPKIIDLRDLHEALSYFINRAKTKGALPIYIFLDEVSALPNWDRVIKGMIDSGELEGSIVIITGSHALDVLRGEEKLSGRMGEFTGEKVSGIYYPLSFREVFEALNKIKIEYKLTDLLEGRTGGIEEWYFRNKEKLAHTFEIYLIAGGYPIALDELLKKRKIDNEIYEVYVNLLVKDALRYELSEKYVLALLDVLCERLTSRVSLNKLARESDLKSHTVVARYLEYLEAAYAVFTVHQLDINRKRADMKKERKIYFVDPFIFHASRTYIWAYSDPFSATIDWLSSRENKARLVENVVISHILRLLPNEIWRRVHLLTYYAENGETDIVTRLSGGYIAIEVKYTEQERRSKTLLRLVNRLNAIPIITTKDKLNLNGSIMEVPVELLLSLID